MTNEEITDMVAASIAAMVERPDVTSHTDVAAIAYALAWGAAELFNSIDGLEYASDAMRRVSDGLAAQAAEGPCSSSGS